MSTGNRYNEEVKQAARDLYAVGNTTYKQVGIEISNTYKFSKPVAKSTIGDWINNGAYAKKAAVRGRKYRKGFFGRFGHKLDRFKHEKPSIPQESAKYANFYEAFRVKLKDNFRRGITKMKNISEETRNLTTHDYINYLVENKGLIYDKLPDVGEIPCNVCGEPVYCFGDNGHDWHLDHIIPMAKEGAPELDNLAIVHSACNMGKGSMLMKDFLDLCRQITSHHSSANGELNEMENKTKSVKTKN